jgi:hypothetical protein
MRCHAGISLQQLICEDLVRKYRHARTGYASVGSAKFRSYVAEGEGLLCRPQVELGGVAISS